MSKRRNKKSGTSNMKPKPWHPKAAQVSAGATADRWDKAPKFIEHDNSVIMRVGLQLMAERLDARGEADDFDALGSAVLIHPRLAITAKHVMDDYMSKFGVEKTGSMPETKFRLSAIQVISDGPEDAASVAVRYAVRNTYHAPSSDLALLTLVPWSPIPPRWDQACARVSIFLPKVGDRAVAFGYHSGEVEKRDDGLVVSRRPATSVGEVTELHLRGRPIVTWPNFTTNALYKAA
jgi:hypothetical protein